MAQTSTRLPETKRRRARDQALETASSLFYAHGVRAVGMEEIVARSGVAKTTIYRHFPTKDDLIAAFLEAEDRDFWAQWDQVTSPHPPGLPQIAALAEWIGARISREGYRGCPQINVAAEFADPTHPARCIARRHKAEMQRRLEAICTSAKVDNPQSASQQIALLFDGAFSSDGRISPGAASLLADAVAKLVQ